MRQRQEAGRGESCAGLRWGITELSPSPRAAGTRGHLGRGLSGREPEAQKREAGRAEFVPSMFASLAVRGSSSMWSPPVLNKDQIPPRFSWPQAPVWL